MKKIKHLLFLSCLRATELIEKKINFELSYKEKLQLKLHINMCNACETYQKQNTIIENSIAQHLNKINKTENFNIEELKKSILDSLIKKSS